MHLYSILCIVVHPKHFTITWGGGGGGLSSTTTSVQHPLGCNGCHRTTALTTHQLQVERRESHRVNQVDGDDYAAMNDKGQWWEFGQDTGVTPLPFTSCAMGFFNDHRESGARFNVSSKRRCFLTV